MLVTPLAGEMEPGSCVGWLDAVFVECVAESVDVVLGGSTRIDDGTKSLFSVEDLCVGVTDGVDLLLDGVTELLSGVAEGAIGVADTLLVASGVGVFTDDG